MYPGYIAELTAQELGDFNTECREDGVSPYRNLQSNHVVSNAEYGTGSMGRGSVGQMGHNSGWVTLVIGSTLTRAIRLLFHEISYFGDDLSFVFRRKKTLLGAPHNTRAPQNTATVHSLSILGLLEGYNRNWRSNSCEFICHSVYKFFRAHMIICMNGFECQSACIEH